MNEERREQLLRLLAAAQRAVEAGEEIEAEYARILFPPKRREYELTYYGKESREQIVSRTYAAPLQEERRFVGTEEKGRAADGAERKVRQSDGAGRDGWINRLIFGDNLQVLKSLVEMKKVGGLKNADGSDGVRLVYIDPPFASKQDFSNDERAYSDKIKGAEFLEWLRRRLVLIREVMADNGSVFVHLDWHKVHYIKVLLDEIFGEGNFRNEIIWHYGTYVGNTKNNFPRKHDSILVYGRSNEERVFFPQRDGSPENDANYKRWQNYFNDNNEITGADYPADDSKFDGYVKRFIRENGREPEPEDVLLRVDGKLVDSVWEIQSVNPMAKEKNGYPTQKPEELLQRIIASSSMEGDLVLDCFGGSGTTAAVAEKMGRRWITGDIGKLSIYTIQKRILEIDGYRTFAVYNAGLYDNAKLNAFDEDQWRQFAMSLWDVEPDGRMIRGIHFDGWKESAPVKVYTPQELDRIGGLITEETVGELYRRLGGSAGSEVYIIAPRGKFAFASDEMDGDGEWDVTFCFLRIPNSMTERFADSFKAQLQASDTDSVNDAVDAVGFDFIRPPKVTYEICGHSLKILSFQAQARIRGNYEFAGMEAFSMLLVDYSYDGVTFIMDEVYYRDDFRDNEAAFEPERIEGQAMLIFIDKFGNEYKTTYGSRE